MIARRLRGLGQALRALPQRLCPFHLLGYGRVPVEGKPGAYRCRYCGQVASSGL